MFLSKTLASPRRALPVARWSQRCLSLNAVTEEDVAHFKKILSTETSILTTLGPNPVPASELNPFNDDWMGKYRGKATTVLKPRTTQEVSEIVKWCSDRRIGIVPQGGNTGLVGGSVPVGQEVILSMSGMAKIRSFDPVSGTYRSSLAVKCMLKERTIPGILIADAGCVLQSLTDHIAPHHHIMPLDLGAKGRCVC